MGYAIGTYEFNTVKEYNAARRDLQKIRNLRKQGKTTAEIARNYKAQISNNHISFESRIGSDYIHKLDKQTLTQGQSVTAEDNNVYVVSEKLRTVKIILMTPLIIVFCLLGVLLFIWIRMEKQSITSIEDVRSMVQSVDEPVSEVSVKNEPTIYEETATPEADVQPIPQEAPQILPKYETLYSQNPDLAGWLSIYNTSIDYPVMYRADDNDYYLNHDFHGQDDVNGLLVLDKRCDPAGNGVNCLIHGHNMKSGAMFGSLKKYENADYWCKHPFINYSTLYEDRTYEVFAVFKSSVYDEATTDFKFFNYIDIATEDQFYEYVNNAKNSALYDTGIYPQWGDSLLTLSTCEYSKENGRLIVVGRCT